MHELSLVQGMLEQLDSMKIQYKLKNISDVHLKVGELSGVDSRFFISAFEMYAPQTPWKDLKIHIHNEPWSIECEQCGKKQIVENYNNVCKDCGSSETRTLNGQEFIIQKIEGESNV